MVTMPADVNNFVELAMLGYHYHSPEYDLALAIELSNDGYYKQLRC